MYEYGHYEQSQDFGLAFLFAVGIPSLYSATFTPEETHRNRGYEKQANRYARNYFAKHFGVEWTFTDKYPL